MMVCDVLRAFYILIRTFDVEFMACGPIGCMVCSDLPNFLSLKRRFICVCYGIFTVYAASIVLFNDDHFCFFLLGFSRREAAVTKTRQRG